MTDELPAFETVMSGMVEKATREMAEQLEYELRGAWRAGYDYVHVYDEAPVRGVGLGQDPLEETLTFTQYVRPSNTNDPRAVHTDEAVYRYTYDLTVVPDEVIQRAIRGE